MQLKMIFIKTETPDHHKRLHIMTRIVQPSKWSFKKEVNWKPYSLR